jgi:hypothetical protein
MRQHLVLLLPPCLRRRLPAARGQPVDFRTYLDRHRQDLRRAATARGHQLRDPGRASLYICMQDSLLQGRRSVR